MKFIYKQAPFSFHFLKYYEFLHDWLKAESAANFRKLSSKNQEGLLSFEWRGFDPNKDLEIGHTL